MPLHPSQDKLASSGRSAWLSLRAWSVLLGATIAGLVADLGTKSLAFASIEPDPHRPGVSEVSLIDGVAKFRLAWNDGAVFGLGAGQQMFFILFTLTAIMLGLLIFARCTRSSTTLAHVAIGVAMAGAVGNLYDRLRFGAVRDFIQLLPGHRLPGGATWPGTNNPEMFPWVFNIADVLLLIGLIMVLRSLRRLRGSQPGAITAYDSHRPLPTPQPVRVDLPG